MRDDTTVITAGNDGLVKIWVPRPGEGLVPVSTFSGHRGAVTGLIDLPDGRVASSGFDGTVQIWRP